MKIYLVKQLNNTFKVAYDSDYERLKKVKVGEVYECEIKQPRNLKFHKKYFALVKMLFDNQERYKDMEELRRDLTIEAGFYNERANFQGEVIREAKSISFASMTQSDFDDLYDRTIYVICQYFNFEKQDILDNLESFM